MPWSCLSVIDLASPSAEVAEHPLQHESHHSCHEVNRVNANAMAAFLQSTAPGWRVVWGEAQRNSNVSHRAIGLSISHMTLPVV